MIKILIGDISEYNKHYRDDIISSYRKALTHKKYNLNNLDSVIQQIQKPIIPVRALLYIKVTTGQNNKVRMDDLNTLLSTLNKYANHKYLDILVEIDKVTGLKDVYSKHDVVLLHRTYKKDMLEYMQREIRKRYPYEDELASELSYLTCKQLRFSSKNLTEYKDIVLNQDYLDEKVIKKVIKLNKSINLFDISYRLVNKKSTGLRQYYNACEKYSKKWVDKQIRQILKNTVNYKMKVFENKKYLAHILNDKDKYKYKELILNTTIGQCYTLFLSFSTNSKTPIESFYYKDLNINS